MADAWFYITGSARCWRKIVQFQRENEQKCIRMGIFFENKMVVYGGKSSANLSPKDEIAHHIQQYKRFTTPNDNFEDSNPL